MTASPDILLVEDKDEDAELVHRALSRYHLATNLHRVRDGAEALAFIASSGPGGGTEPRLVILDLKLPNVGGLEVLRALKEATKTRAIPVVVLTSSLDEQDLASAYSFGADSYVVKPVAFDDFIRAVGSVCAYWMRSSL